MLDRNIILTIILILGTFLALSLSRFFLHKTGNMKKISKNRIYYVVKTFNILIISFALFLGLLIWSVSLNGLLVFASSIFAVVGIALFAQWSILSNITSSILIFFTFPTRIGDFIKIIDGDNSVEGEIVEISLFYIKILTQKEEMILYPNNLFVQKPVIKINKNL
ncbi:MAG: mechanosensitive ion channel [Sulfurospirillaceae bacterium]|nr:mechanosensitive ion channel [Sulfurospirillaceae bacterium]